MLMALFKKPEEDEAAEAEVKVADVVVEEEAEVVQTLVNGNDASPEVKAITEANAEMGKVEEEASEVDVVVVKATEESSEVVEVVVVEDLKAEVFQQPPMLEKLKPQLPTMRVVPA